MQKFYKHFQRNNIRKKFENNFTVLITTNVEDIQTYKANVFYKANDKVKIKNFYCCTLVF